MIHIAYFLITSDTSLETSTIISNVTFTTVKITLFNRVWSANIIMFNVVTVSYNKAVMFWANAND